MMEYIQIIVQTFPHGNVPIIFLLPRNVITTEEYNMMTAENCTCDIPILDNCDWCDNPLTFVEKDWIDRPGVVKLGYTFVLEVIPDNIKITGIVMFDKFIPQKKFGTI